MVRLHDTDVDHKRNSRRKPETTQTKQNKHKEKTGMNKLHVDTFTVVKLPGVHLTEPPEDPFEHSTLK